MNAIRRIEDVLIVGGGDIGLITALSIKKLNPEIEVQIVDNFAEDPPQVGKSTYIDITTILHSHLGIPFTEFLSEVKPIWKGTVYFERWCDDPPFHYAFDEKRKFVDKTTPNSIEHYFHQYDEVCFDPSKRSVNEVMAEEGKSGVYYDLKEGYVTYDSYAYHLDLKRFNSFLREVCADRGVRLIDDEITDVEADRSEIETVSGGAGRYRADLYVDASGFNRVLREPLGGEFREFEIPLDSAVTAKFERPLSEAVCATVIRSGDHGWFWQIDTYEFRDLGYVYASDFVEDERAAAEFIEFCGEFADGSVSRSELTQYRFDSGYYRTPFQGNCLTIGNAAGFVEPLQSTGLTANAHCAVEFSHLLSAHGGCNQDVMEKYNAWTARLWESIYDFVCVHYRYSSGSNEFWQAMRSIPVSRRLETIIESFHDHGYDTEIDPVENDGSVENLVVFYPLYFYSIMRRMGGESALYESGDIEVSDRVKELTAEVYERMEDEAEQLLTVEELYKGVLTDIDSPAGMRH